MYRSNADWLPNYYSPAVDFAIVEAEYVKENRNFFFYIAS
jgi:hypothetical protein